MQQAKIVWFSTVVLASKKVGWLGFAPVSDPASMQVWRLLVLPPFLVQGLCKSGDGWWSCPRFYSRVYASLATARAWSAYSRGVWFFSDVWGRSSLYSFLQASILSRASASEVNHEALSSSFRTLALNDSMKALSVGVAGREKSSCTLLKNAH